MPRLRNANPIRPGPGSRHRRGYDNDWARRSKRVIAEHVAQFGMVCPGLEELGHEPHPVSGVGGDRLTGDHPDALGLGGSHDQEPRVLCQSWNTRRGAITRAQIAELRASGYPVGDKSTDSPPPPVRRPERKRSVRVWGG